MAELVYLLCALTSSACTVLLVRSWRRTHQRLLLWSSLCFAGLALNNLLLVVDLVLVPETDLALLRSSTAIAALALLLVGLVWETP
jgi:hypothetical protein